MIAQEAMSERAIILAPLGRDSQIALMMLNEAGYDGVITRDLVALCSELEQGAGLLLISSEALLGGDLEPLLLLIEQQPAWSDLPIVLMTYHGGPEQNPASRYGPQLGNVTFLERPFHPVTLISLVTTALRGRRRQYEARDRLIDLSQSELRLQNTLETLEQQVEERTAQLRHNEEALRQSQKMEAVGQLTGGIAHDFNNMLTGIIGSLELLRRRLARGRTEDLDSLIDLGVTSANRAAGLTHRLLAFSRRQSLDSKPVAMNTLVVSMGELLQRSINETIQLDMQLNEQLWVAEADPNQLESALLNLVINARDAMPDGGKLVVKTSNQHLDLEFTKTQSNLQPGDYVVLSVTDTGCGMPPSTISRAFDPFFTTKPIGQGTGLGLSMIYGFSKQSRGHVAIQSEVGEGTTVSLFLPRCGSDLPQDNPVNVQHAPYARNGETVLIVEDDPAVRVLVSTVLSDLGYAFVEAGDADSAVPILDSGQRIDLLISDVGLPGMNGRQLAEIGRQYRPDLKVLFITGYAEHAAVRGGFLDPGMQMITKPFTFDLLTAKVREMIRI
ncbi:His Kinase A (phospho-acceptor) domain-containing protein [Pseudomonas frederiksbergensis]|uniref:histidine kinase n=2 Tax=Pseudomonas TaxID=286 RepID=A0A1H5C9T2_9PSED|nr:MULTISPECIES: ATP-binding protein [Pseudomonas]PMU12084.1 hybrid sensor histidine kinase/response regulator [Pseudomonas sp. FW305-20]PMU20864.1 hybrid sensor histidine kinase/response regulator [Pseudomonas sp. FW305-122]PMU41795.1 hybrid sensor histidine kinase/response regulator [Pseudomonas sp. FW305-47B]PMX65329.1 hybrid sensor histidine kinase/response regulator [Pseudomonas sp. FW305-33]PMX71888.1 hybrid sensor histidine kinase/response regulator [Pseudomonas sp. FW305-60]